MQEKGESNGENHGVLCCGKEKGGDEEPQKSQDEKWSLRNER
jgi:hypothetical protein